jgi:hypothetical protein
MKKLAVLFLVFIVMACQQEKKHFIATDSIAPVKSAFGDTLTYSYDSVKVLSKIKTSANKNTTDSAVATLVYPVFSNTKINELVQENALKSSNPDQPAYHSYKEMATGFIKDFDDFRKENQDYGQAWFKEVRISVLAQQKNYLGLKYFFTDYTGGAHPNTAIIYKNYDPQTQEEITLDALVSPANHEKLVAVAEQIFRKNEKLTATQSLADKYFFEKGEFALNNNFTITSQGLKFLYNSYEIKPYSEGITELLIPFTAIKYLLKTNPALPPIK